MRDYALGIIEMAQRAKCVVLPKTASRNLATPYPNTPSTFTSNGTPDPKVEDAIGHAIQMDFGNYTIGRLIPQRSNYDDKHPDYVQVLAKIKRRIFDLGYREERFKNSDREIGNTSWNARDQDKVDRYGKKPAQRRQLLEALRTNGLIEEDAISRVRRSTSSGKA